MRILPTVIGAGVGVFVTPNVLGMLGYTERSVGLGTDDLIEAVLIAVCVVAANRFVPKVG